MASNAFPTPFNINRIQAIPGPTGERGSNGPPGVGNGLDVTAAPFSADPTGSADCSTAFADASTAAASDASRTVYVPAGTYKHSTTATISGNLHFAPGAMLKPASGQTVTITGLIYAHERQQIFDLSAGGVVLPVANQRFVPGWWGAKGDGITDDYAALQACADALPVYESGHSGDAHQNINLMYIPSGKYLISKPLLLNKLAMRVIGEGQFATRIQRAPDMMGPMFIAAPDYAMALPLATSLVAGPGQSLRMDPTGSTYAVALKDSPRANFDGMTAWTVEFFFKVANASGSSGCVMRSGSSLRTGVAGDEMFVVNITGASEPYNIQTLVTTTAGSANPGNLVGTVNHGDVHHLAITYDGANVKWWLDGALDTTVASSGALLQQFYEAVQLGWHSAYYPEDAQILPFNGYLDSVRFSNNVRYTTPFTAPTAKFTLDSHTLLLFNFDKTYHQCLVADASGSIDGFGSTNSLAYFVSRPDPNVEFGLIPYGQVEVANLGWDAQSWGNAGFITFAPGSNFHDMDFSGCVRGLNWWNNNFESACDRITVAIAQPHAGNTGLGGTYRTAGDYGFNFGVSGITTVTGCFVTGGAVGIVNQFGALLITDFTYGVNAAAQLAYLAGDGDVSTINGFFVDNESPSGLWIAGVLFNNSVLTTFINANFDISLSSNPGKPVLLQANTGGTEGQNKAVFIGCSLYPSSGGTICAGDAAQLTPIEFIACKQAGPHSGVAWGSANATPVVDGGITRTISSGSSSTAKNWDRVIALKVAGTYNLTTPPAPTPGQALVVKDQQGDAGANTKTITANAGQTIDGAATATITVNGGKLALCFDGVSDWMS